MKLRQRVCEERCLASRSAGRSCGVAASRSLRRVSRGGALRRDSGPPAPPTWVGGWRGFPSAGPRGLRVQVRGHCAGRAQRPFVCRVVCRPGGVCGAKGRLTGASRPLRRTTVGVSVSAPTCPPRQRRGGRWCLESLAPESGVPDSTRILGTRPGLELGVAEVGRTSEDQALFL